MIQKIQQSQPMNEFGSKWDDVPQIKSKFAYLLDKKIKETDDDCFNNRNSNSSGIHNMDICDHVGFNNSINDLNRTISDINRERM